MSDLVTLTTPLLYTDFLICYFCHGCDLKKKKVTKRRNERGRKRLGSWYERVQSTAEYRAFWLEHLHPCGGVGMV